MQDLRFTFAKAVNILCFGPAGVEFHFSDYGHIVQILGLNLDNPGSEDSSNGSGKSTIQEILSIALYGRTVKNPTKLKGGQFINVLADEGMVEVQWDDCRVVRTFKREKNGTIKAKIRCWESPDKIWDDNSDKKFTKSTDAEAWILRKLKLSHKAFCNVAIFDDSSTYSFLELDGPAKREFVENLLELESYRDYHTTAKNLLKTQKELADNLAKEYQQLQMDITSCASRITMVQKQESNWRQQKQQEKEEIAARLARKQKQLESTDIGEQLTIWESAQEKIAQLSQTIIDSEAKRIRVNEVIATARLKLDAARRSKEGIHADIQQHTLSLQKAKMTLETHLKLISKLEGLEDGARCPTCHGIISKENYAFVLADSHQAADQCRTAIHLEQTGAASNEDRIKQKATAIRAMEEKIRDAESRVAQFEASMKQVRQQISELAKVQKPDGDTVERILESAIVELKKQLKAKTEELEEQSPYAEILQAAEQEKIAKQLALDGKGKEVEQAEKLVPYYEYWVFAFSDRGIRKYIIDGIIPALNGRIAYWLQFLIDSKIELTFNNEFDETITRSGNPAFYYSMSKGECRRINLALSQAFAYVKMLNSGSCPGLVFLDEVTGGGIDKAGIPGVYNMIFELAKERQVFVTTHNEHLSSMLRGCETINLKKENDVTVVID